MSNSWVVSLSDTEYADDVKVAAKLRQILNHHLAIQNPTRSEPWPAVIQLVDQSGGNTLDWLIIGSSLQLLLISSPNSCRVGQRGFPSAHVTLARDLKNNPGWAANGKPSACRTDRAMVGQMRSTQDSSRVRA